VKVEEVVGEVAGEVEGVSSMNLKSFIRDKNIFIITHIHLSVSNKKHAF
jgi:hypothetical protein